MSDATVLKSETVGTVRTTVNVTILALIVSLIAKVTGWKVRAEDILPYVPLLIPVIAAFYRLSLYVAQKVTWIGVLLYGINSAPSYKPPAPPVENAIILPPEGDRGDIGLMDVVLVLAAICLVIWLTRAL